MTNGENMSFVRDFEIKNFPKPEMEQIRKRDFATFIHLHYYLILVVVCKSTKEMSIWW